MRTRQQLASQKLLGSPLRQGGSLEDSLQVTDTSFCNMVMQEPQPASVRASEYLSDLPRTAIEYLSHSRQLPTSVETALLESEWVEALEQRLGYQFDHTYNCLINGKGGLVPAGTVESAADMHGPLAKHALYFLSGCRHRQVLEIMNEYASFKMEHATSTACFILPRRKAQWNLRVLHMQVLGVIA